ncbi:hypothetical protein KSP40_PGU017685 [Platanthera guangdongensis]|uniref:Uncharacterized protein n=1 Tax=Platanthera guangdongensis TaxID=2320717 RepID=A0ABR2MVZ0_9ASPA
MPMCQTCQIVRPPDQSVNPDRQKSTCSNTRKTLNHGDHFRLERSRRSSPKKWRSDTCLVGRFNNHGFFRSLHKTACSPEQRIGFNHTFAIICQISAFISRLSAALTGQLWRYRLVRSTVATRRYRLHRFDLGKPPLIGRLTASRTHVSYHAVLSPENFQYRPRYQATQRFQALGQRLSKEPLKTALKRAV